MSPLSFVVFLSLLFYVVVMAAIVANTLQTNRDRVDPDLIIEIRQYFKFLYSRNTSTSRQLFFRLHQLVPVYHFLYDYSDTEVPLRFLVNKQARKLYFQIAAAYESGPNLIK